MGKEKIILGKKDNGHHDGRFSNVKRLAAADFALQEFLEDASEDMKTNASLPLTEMHYMSLSRIAKQSVFP